jgi:hypothetical protein
MIGMQYNSIEEEDTVGVIDGTLFWESETNTI